MGNGSAVVIYVSDAAYADLAVASRCMDRAGITAVVNRSLIFRYQTADAHGHISTGGNTCRTGAVIDGSLVVDCKGCSEADNSRLTG